MARYRIACRPISFAKVWYMTNRPLDNRWTEDARSSMSFPHRGHAKAYLKTIGHSGVGVEIVPEHRHD